MFDLAVLSMNNRYDEAEDERLLDAYFRGNVSDGVRWHFDRLRRALGLPVLAEP